MTSIKIVANTPEDLIKKRELDLEKYEHSHNVSVNYRQFSLIVYGDNNSPIAVLEAYTAFAEIYIDDIWVDTQHRHKGFGKMLLNHLEQHFDNKGFNNINLVTSHFQAPEFYQKCGYELEFIRKNKVNPQFDKYFYIKYFNNQKQTQGLIN